MPNINPEQPEKKAAATDDGPIYRNGCGKQAPPGRRCADCTQEAVAVCLCGQVFCRQHWWRHTHMEEK
jgi:hypothetical protein